MGCMSSANKRPAASAEKPEVGEQAQQPAPAILTSEPVPTKEASKEAKPGSLPTELRVGEQVKTSQGHEGTVVRMTTTDVLLKMSTNGKEQWFEREEVKYTSTDMPLKGLKAGDKVSTSKGIDGRLLKRTTTEVLLKLEDGEQKWVDIEDVTVLKVSIISASRLRNRDLMSKSDPFCICEIEGKPATKVRTPTVMNNLEPCWNFEAEVIGYTTGDTLSFSVWDEDMLGTSQSLGRAVLTSEQLHGEGFLGELNLLDDLSSPPPKLCIKVEVVAGAPAPLGPSNLDLNLMVEGSEQEEGRKVQDVMVTMAEAPTTKGWCCSCGS